MIDPVCSDDLLLSYFRRWTEIEDRKDECADDGKELASEAKSHGFNAKAMRAAFQRLRKMEKDGPAFAEGEAEIDLYVTSLTRARHAREAGAVSSPAVRAVA